MDQERFDQMTKTLARGLSRRSIVAGIGAALAGLGRGGASANHKGSHGGGPKPGRCGKAGQPCKWGTQCCSGDCYNGYCTACPIDSPNQCPATGGCHPACPEGKVFNPETCACECVEQPCCTCVDTDGNVFCNYTASTIEECSALCREAFPGGYGGHYVNGGPGTTASCDGAGSCEVTCQ